MQYFCKQVPEADSVLTRIQKKMFTEGCCWLIFGHCLFAVGVFVAAYSCLVVKCSPIATISTISLSHTHAALDFVLSCS
jgi:hypothetical protein